MDERNFWLGFSVFSGVGPIKFKMLFTRFGSAKDAWEASGSDLEKVIGERLAEKFDEFRNEFSITDYINQLEKKDVSFIILPDKEYPKPLSQIRNPPFLLYIKGDTTTLYSSRERSESRSDVIPDLIGNLDSRFRGNDKFSSRQARTITPTIAVVGTRRTTQYGREVTALLAQELVANGFTIVSGLAIGVDAVSHRAAIDNGGKTIAVLGCGVDCCNPAENLRLYNDIIQKGSVVISELPLGHPPTKGSFPSRNRIIAGLSMGVLVTEGAEDSGSLITASYAIKFGRKVFAVPGPITSSLSKGPYKLIEKGARLVTKAEDILQELGIRNHELGSIKGRKGIKSIKGETKEEIMILKILQNEPMHFDEIVRKTGLQSSELGSILSLMEVKGMVKGLEGGMFSI